MALQPFNLGLMCGSPALAVEIATAREWTNEKTIIVHLSQWVKVVVSLKSEQQFTALD
jgi:hypothetical protein